MAETSNTILEVRNISKEFPGVKALDDVSVTLSKGEVRALCGENGAGKSTLIKILAGTYVKDGGEILFEGKPIEINSSHDSLSMGIKVVFQELSLIQGLSVAENVFLESFPLKKGRAIDWQRMYDRTAEILGSIGIDVSPKTQVGSLTISQQQMVEIGRALSHEAKVIIMDEPTSALTPKEIRSLFDSIEKLKKMGIGILYVTHKLEEVFEICDTITVLRDGKLISNREIRDTDNGEIVKDMVGREITTLFPKSDHPAGAPILEVANLSTEKKLKNVSFQLRKGEVIGVFGLLGAGRTELAKAVFGLDPVTKGTVTVGGEPVRPGSTAHSTQAGMGLLTEDRKEEGLVPQMSVTHNMTLPSLADFSTAGFMRQASEDKRAREFVDKISIKTPSLKQKIMYLSGGNQQKVLLARWLMKELKVIILDEPTRGIDVGAKAEIHKLIDDLAKDGVAVLMMTSEMPELMGVSDRIIVMNDGRITGNFDRNDVNQEQILAAAIQ
jgi:ribose transport system ATP-binding protein